MFSWTISSFNNKGIGWYITAGIGSLALIIWGFFVGLYAMSIVVFMVVGVYILIENNAPESTVMMVDENGVHIGNSFYDYPSIDEFSIIYDGKKPILLRIKIKKRWISLIDIELNQDVNVAELRFFLAQYLKESEKWGELTNSERLMRYLKI